MTTDLRNQLMPDTELTWYTNGSSFVKEGKSCAGMAVMMEGENFGDEALPSGTSSQKAELIALTMAL